MNTMRKVMSRETAEHFYAWLATLPADEQHEAEEAIHVMLSVLPPSEMLFSKQPWLPSNVTWNEIYEAAKAYRRNNKA